jgi:hypothetical protein
MIFADLSARRAPDGRLVAFLGQRMYTAVYGNGLQWIFRADEK